MKKKLLLMLLAIALAAGAAQANMLKNPGFEEGSFETNFSPDYWENYYTTYGQVHTWLSDAGAHSGSKYIKMYNWLIRGTTYVTTAYFGQEVLGVKEGKDYTFSVWAKNGVQGRVNLAEIYIDWLDSAGSWLTVDGASAFDFVDIPVTDANWVEIDFGAITAPKGAGGAWVWLATPLDNGTKPIFYDDVTMLGPDPNITAGVDMISWDGQTISLTGTTTLDGYSTITWSAEPAYAAVITDGDTLTPAVEVDCIIPSGPATIENHSFENGLDNWEILTGDGHGTWGGYDEPNGLKVFITPTDGLECAYVNGVEDGAGTLSQVLVNTLAANTDYTLTVDVVNDGYYTEDVAYRVQLRAGESFLAQDNDSHALDTYGAWETSTVNFSTGATHAALGEQLEIRLIAKAGTQEMTFDNVVLTANPAFGAYVPDVLTLKMKLDIDGKYDTMKIDTYPDACAARLLGAGLREVTDLVGNDCITNLADLAEMVKTWPDNNAFTEPKAKPSGEWEYPFNGPEDFSMNPNLATEWTQYVYYSSDLVTTTWNSTDEDLDLARPDGQSGIGLYRTGSSRAPKEPVTLTVKELSRTGGTWGFLGLMITAVEQPGYIDTADDTYTLRMRSDGTTTFVFQVTRTYLDGESDYVLFQSADETFSGPYVLDIERVGDNYVFLVDGTVLYTTGNAAGDVYDTATRDSMVYYQIVMAGDGAMTATVDDFGYKNPIIPSPDDGAYVYPDSDLELSWTNMDPNYPGDLVYVDVWFGTEPNDLPPPDPDYDYNKIVDSVEDANSVTVDVSTPIPETYYWQVNSYIYGSPTGDPIESPLWTFHVVTDAPVSVNAGGDVVTWSGKEVQLNATIDDDGVSDLIIDGWSADPNDGVVFDPNEFVEDPTVTITKVTDNPSIVTLTLSAHDAVGSDDDTLNIEVYDTACLAAIGDEGVEIETGDFDADCDTDLEDYATVAEQWLVYNELTTSIVKP